MCRCVSRYSLTIEVMFCYICGMPKEQTKCNRSVVLRALGIGGGTGFIFVVLLVILVIIWAVEP